mmetsp:Transcript_21173/g.63722  ORF Transcript_21173/g.63722 Transcript_21173/m.63722 type:complete len:245 (-) Transcript_21173:1210-1944(-)
MLGGGGGWLHVQLQGLRLPVHPQAALEVPPAAELCELVAEMALSVFADGFQFGAAQQQALLLQGHHPLHAGQLLPCLLLLPRQLPHLRLDVCQSDADIGLALHDALLGELLLLVQGTWVHHVLLRLRHSSSAHCLGQPQLGIAGPVLNHCAACLLAFFFGAHLHGSFTISVQNAVRLIQLLLCLGNVCLQSFSLSSPASQCMLLLSQPLARAFQGSADGFVGCHEFLGLCREAVASILFCLILF